jgi:hypothetical protein
MVVCGWCMVDDYQVREINCSIFQYKKGCQTHEELKVLVSKFNRKINNKTLVLGVLVYVCKWITESKVCSNVNALFRENPILYVARGQAQVCNYMWQMFPGEAWIYLAHKFLKWHIWASCQVLFLLDGAKNRCSHILMLQNPQWLFLRPFAWSPRDTLRYKCPTIV